MATDQTHAPEKPAFGSPCNGCGFCCAAEVCGVGRVVFETDVAPCPGLRWDGGQFRCRAVELSDVVGGVEAAMLRLVMGIGRGCDSEAS